MPQLDGRSWAVLPTLFVNWAVLAQILSFRGLVLWIVVPSITCWLLVSVALANSRRLLAWTASLTLPFAFVAVAELIGGSTSGPISRTTFMSCGLTAVASLIAMTQYARLCLIPMILLLASGLALGASGDAVAWVGIWMVAAAFTLVILGPYSEHELLAFRRLRFMASIMALSGVVSVAGAAAAVLVVRSPWVVQVSGNSTQGTSAIDSDKANSGSPSLDPAQGASAVSMDIVNGLGALALKAFTLVLIGLVLYFVVGIARRMLISIGWRVGLRGLETGSTRQQVLGAWSWIRLRLVQRDQPLPLHLSPDVAVRWAESEGRAELAELAALVAPVAFGSDIQPTPEQAYRAWELADEIDFASRGATWRLRWKYSRRSIRATRLELAHQAVDFNQRAAGVPS